MKAATIDALAKLSEAHRLKIRTDVDGTRVIVGRTGQLYEYDDAHLGVIYTSPKDKTSQRWNTAREALVTLGATVRQWGDRERQPVV